jgi:cytochrome c-type biogenesis protein CcmE
VSEPPQERELFRIGGMVQDGSIVRGEGLEVSFVVTDCWNVVPVTFNDILPSLFEGQGMVGQVTTLTEHLKPLKFLPNMTKNIHAC